MTQYFRQRQGRYTWEPGRGLRARGFHVITLRRADGLPFTNADDASELAAKINTAVAAGADPKDAERIAAGGAVPHRPAVAAGTLADLARRYQQHRRFTTLRASTRRVYRQSLKIICAWGGARRVVAIDGPAVQAFHGSLADTPHKAINAVRVLRLLLEFARRDLGLIQINPAAAPGIKTPRRKAPRIWTRAEIAAMAAAAQNIGLPAIAMAIRLNHWACQRANDLIRLPRSAYRDGGLTIAEQSKTRDRGAAGGRCYLPVDDIPFLGERLQAYLDRAARCAVVPTTLLANDRTGRPFTDDQFYRQFCEVRRAARLPELSFKHLRHTGMTHYADAGVAPAGIACISGHDIGTFDSEAAILATYITVTMEQARAAVRLRLSHEDDMRKTHAPFH